MNLFLSILFFTLLVTNVFAESSSTGGSEPLDVAPSSQGDTTAQPSVGEASSTQDTPIQPDESIPSSESSTPSIPTPSLPTFTPQSTIPDPLATNHQNVLSPTLPPTISIQKQIDDSGKLISDLMGGLQRQTNWARSVHEIIQNYQYKYSKVLERIKEDSEKLTKARGVLSALHQARLRQSLRDDLDKVTLQLNELSAQTPDTTVVGTLDELKTKLHAINTDITKMHNSDYIKDVLQTGHELHNIDNGELPPLSNDALSQLLNTELSPPPGANSPQSPSQVQGAEQTGALVGQAIQQATSNTPPPAAQPSFRQLY